MLIRGLLDMEKPLSQTGHHLAKKMGRAIARYKMIAAGDRVLVAVSGGKDSLTLLTLLQARKKWLPIDYELLAVHIQTDYRCAGCVHTETLKSIFEQRKLRYYIEKIEILKNPDGSQNKISCFWCSWNRRKALFALAAKYDCNKIALGHHKDDIIQTQLLNMFYQAQISTMTPKVSMFQGQLDIIRPLAFIEEKEIVRFAAESKFPAQLCQCPNGNHSKRKLMKEMIETLAEQYPAVKNNIFKSVQNIRKDYLL